MFGSELHRVRHERGLSLRALANRVRYDYSYLSRIESGQRRPPVELARILDRVLDTGGLFHDLLLRPGEAAAPPSEPERASARVRDDTAITDLAELRRRALHDCLVGQSISAASLDDWDMCTLRHAAAAKYREPSVLLADLATDFGELQTALTSCRSVKALRRLTRVAAQLSGLVCLALIKLDQRPAFRRWARTARLAAAEVGDPTTTSWVLAQEAYGHFYAHDVEEALTVSTWAQSVAGPCVGSVLAAALEARAQAVRGDENASRGALARAEEIFSLLNAESVADHSAFGYNEAQLPLPSEQRAHSPRGHARSCGCPGSRARGRTTRRLHGPRSRPAGPRDVSRSGWRRRWCNHMCHRRLARADR